MFEWLTGRTDKKISLKWGREFRTVKRGLDEEQVTALVEDLLAEQKASREALETSLRSVFDTAASDAVQMAADIKMKARAGAEAEAGRIIGQANEEVKEIRRKAEATARNEAEDILSAANREAEITGVEVKQKALLFLLRAREEIEKAVKEEYKQAHSRLSQSLQNLTDEGQNIIAELQEKTKLLWENKSFELKEFKTAEKEMELSNIFETPVAQPESEASPEAEVEPDITGQEHIEEPTRSGEETAEQSQELSALLNDAGEKEMTEPVKAEAKAADYEVRAEAEESSEQLPGEEKAERGESSVQLDLDREELYVGEIELAIAVPLDPAAASKFYDRLQTTPELKIVRTTGTWDEGSTIKVSLEKPMPLIRWLEETPGIEVIPETLEQVVKKGKSGSLARNAGGQEVKRLKITLKEK
ncbi:MAG: hypothetical protein Q8O55_10435 [Dehalococcoidales bacterium]|nr:hypothetical protein [Dehalococcoidales bacterium]